TFVQFSNTNLATASRSVGCRGRRLASAACGGLWKQSGNSVSEYRKRLRLLPAGVPARYLCAGTRLQQPQGEHVKSCEKRDHQQDSPRLSMDKTHQRLRTRQNLGLKPKSFFAE